MRTTLQQLAARTVCLNWEGAPERWAQTQEECRRVGVPVERWPGADKRRLPDLPSISSGQLACTLGHLSIAEALMESGDAAWLVLEDDVVFCRNFSQHWTETLLAVPDDWDFLFLGVTWRTASTPVRGRLHRLHAAYSTHAYLMTARGAHAWLRSWLRSPRKIADHYTMDLMRSGEAKVYGAVPYWAVQRREALSLIEGQDRSDEYEARFGGWFEDDRPVEIFPEPELEPEPTRVLSVVFNQVETPLPQSSTPLLR